MKTKYKKVKIISEQFMTTFKHQINEFLSQHRDIVDIQYQYGGAGNGFSAMIIYEE